jgi:hypothetical protein
MTERMSQSSGQSVHDTPASGLTCATPRPIGWKRQHGVLVAQPGAPIIQLRLG